MFCFLLFLKFGVRPYFSQKVKLGLHNKVDTMVVPLNYIVTCSRLLQYTSTLKGIVLRNFEWLQIILMNRSWVPDVPLKVYSFLNLHLHTIFKVKSFERVKFLLMHFAKA